MIETWKLNGGGNPGSRLFSNIIGDVGTTWRVFFHRRDPAGGVEVQRYLYEPALKGELEQWSPELGANDDVYRKAGPLTRALFFLSRGAAEAREETKTPAPRSPLVGGPHASALLPAGMGGIGNDRTAAIWYQALTTELQPLSGYRDARRAALKAARQLYGPDSREDLAVRDAFAATAVGRPGRLVDPIDTWIPRVEPRVEAGPELALSMTVPEAARIRSAAFLVDGVPQKVFTGPPFSLTLAAGRRFSNGEHSFQVLVRDVEDQVECSAARTFMLHNPVSQLLVDPTLENVLKWCQKGNSWLINDDIMKPGPAGPRAVFDAHLQTTAPYLKQRVTLPPAPVKLQLSFWLETGGGAEAKSADSLRLKVFEAPDGPAEPGAPLLEAEFTAAGASTGRVRHTNDLSPFAGKRVTIGFFGDLAGKTGAAFQVDTVTLLAGPGGAAEWAESKDVRDPGD
jgi:hypothetical protein